MFAVFILGWQATVSAKGCKKKEIDFGNLNEASNKCKYKEGQHSFRSFKNMKIALKTPQKIKVNIIGWKAIKSLKLNFGSTCQKFSFHWF